MFCLVIFLGLYVYMALALQPIANKTKTENSWLAWIPIVNIVLILNIAKKPIWWIILFFIPLVNIVKAIIVWMGSRKHAPSRVGGAWGSSSQSRTW